MLTEHEQWQRTHALSAADHPHEVDRYGNVTGGGYLTVYRAGDGYPIGYAYRVLNGWNQPRRWRAIMTFGELAVGEVGDRHRHRCAEDAERSLRAIWNELSDEDAYAGPNIGWGAP